MVKMKKKMKNSNGHSDGMAGPIFKILEVLEIGWVTLTEKKLKKIEK